MPIRFVCPRCKTPNSWPSASAGSTVRCPQCSKEIAIPASLTKKKASLPPEPEPTPHWSQFETDEALPTLATSETNPPVPVVSSPWHRLVEQFALNGASIRRVCWILLLGWVGLCALYYTSAQRNAQSEIQQAAISADTAALLIGGYVVVRAIEKIAKG
jgi:DNA-directed RNA polymerase subunit RPC12/RpoP